MTWWYQKLFNRQQSYLTGLRLGNKKIKTPKKMRRLGIIANYQFKNNQNVAV